jgi:hypothetical protein
MVQSQVTEAQTAAYIQGTNHAARVRKEEKAPSRTAAEKYLLPFNLVNVLSLSFVNWLPLLFECPETFKPIFCWNNLVR